MFVKVYTDKTKQVLQKRTTVWRKNIFNAGQLACDRALYTIPEIKTLSTNTNFDEQRTDDQEGLNVLVAHAGVPIINLTLASPMESTWAGDYTGNPQDFWTSPERTPYLIHWYGGLLEQTSLPINKIYMDFLSKAEMNEWNELVNKQRTKQKSARRKALLARIAGRAEIVWRALSAGHTGYVRDAEFWEMNYR